MEESIIRIPSRPLIQKESPCRTRPRETVPTWSEESAEVSHESTGKFSMILRYVLFHLPSNGMWLPNSGGHAIGTHLLYRLSHGRRLERRGCSLVSCKMAALSPKANKGETVSACSRERSHLLWFDTCHLTSVVENDVLHLLVEP